MNYFGTDLREAGHYLWIAEGNYLARSRVRLYDLPFNAESLPIIESGDRRKGTVEFYNAFGRSIMAIEGSCSDTRPGTKSVFWVKELISYEEMKERLLEIPVVVKIIEQMPFEVKWLDKPSNIT